MVTWKSAVVLRIQWKNVCSCATWAKGQSLLALISSNIQLKVPDHIQWWVDVKIKLNYYNRKKNIKAVRKYSYAFPATHCQVSKILQSQRFYLHLSVWNLQWNFLLWAKDIFSQFVLVISCKMGISTVIMNYVEKAFPFIFHEALVSFPFCIIVTNYSLLILSVPSMMLCISLVNLPNRVF